VLVLVPVLRHEVLFDPSLSITVCLHYDVMHIIFYYRVGHICHIIYKG